MPWIKVTRLSQKKRLRPKTFVLSLLVFLLSFMQIPAFAEESASQSWSFSMGSGLELLYGTAYEYVYDNVNGNKLSELDWDIKPLVSVSSLAEAKFGGFGFGISCALGFPGDTGIIADSDWKNEGTPYPNVKTNYSESSARAEHMTDLRISLGYNFSLTSGFDLKPFVGFRYMNIAWSASGGWWQYADNDSLGLYPYHEYTTGIKYRFYGLLGTYEQTYAIPIIGLAGKIPLSDTLKIQVGIQASPWIWFNSFDNHILKGWLITDTMRGGYLIEPDLAIDWMPTQRIQLHAGIKYTTISGLKGDATYSYTSGGASPGASSSYNNAAGAALKAFGFGISAEWNL
jgi:outer membrane protease